MTVGSPLWYLAVLTLGLATGAVVAWLRKRRSG